MKRNFKKAMSIILAAVILLCSAPLSVFVGLELPDLGTLFAPKAEAAITSGTCGENLTWNFDEATGELVISGIGTMEEYEKNHSLLAPWYDIRSSIISVSIQNGVTRIGTCAFEDCDSLTSVAIPDSVTSIGESAFYDCDSLTSVSIPDSVTSVASAFCSCDSLTSITVSPLNSAYSSDEYGVLFNKNKTELLQYPIGNPRTSYSIPDGVTSTGYRAFLGCKNITSVNIPDSVTDIGDRTFSGCENLTNVTIPDSVTFIGDNAFLSCYRLESAKIGKGIAVLRGFTGCYALKNIFISKNVCRIARFTFYDTEIENVYYAGSKSEWEQIKIDIYNEGLSSAKIYYNFTTDIDPSTVKSPSTTSISYGDSIILHVDESKIPEGGYVEWTADNNNFSYKADGTTCTISPEKSGDTTFTATIYDAQDNPVSTDVQTMTSKAGFFDKIIAFFKGIFGLNKTIPNVFKF